MYVSVIIPSFNAENTIANCINSCIIQEGYLKEIIVVDDFSTDNTWAVVDKLKDFHLYTLKLYSNPMKGGNNARNFGFKKATGQFIQWLDADDELGENKLKNQVEFLLRTNRFQIAYCDWRIINVHENGNFNVEVKEENRSTDFLVKLLEDKWLPPHAYLLRYDSALKLFENNGWNPESIVLQDREYYTIAALLGMKFGYVNNTFVKYYRYKSVFSVSKINGKTRSLALLNLMIRIRNLISNEFNKQEKIEIRINSLILISKIQLGLEVEKYVNPRKILWRMFPGNWLKLKAVLKLYLPFY